MRRSLRPALAVLFASTLAACGGRVGEVFDSRQNIGPCPPAGSLYDAARVVKFDGDDEIFSNVTYTGEITDVRAECRYVGDDPVTVRMEVDFAFGRGPSATSNAHSYSYFVAVTRRDATVLERQTFDVRAEFGNAPVTGTTERITEITIPRADESISAANFEVIVGFVLDEEQLAFNRGGKRFRLDARVAD